MIELTRAIKHTKKYKRHSDIKIEYKDGEARYLVYTQRIPINKQCLTFEEINQFKKVLDM